MTIDQALSLFHEYGNVGKDIQDLKRKKPTNVQLEQACIMATARGLCPNMLKEAKAAIVKYFGMGEES